MKMIISSRKFERKDPAKDARVIYIFCEGAKREVQYFKYFCKLSSRIKLEIYQLKLGDDHSPRGLLNIAKKNINGTEENPIPKYEFLENDEVWIIFDTDKDKEDSRRPQINEIRKFCEKNKGWFSALSNPCFEVWLYYHNESQKPDFEGDKFCKGWKQIVNNVFPGGFDSKKHSANVENAIENAKRNFCLEDGLPAVGSTEVFRLVERDIFSFILEKIKRVHAKLPNS